MAVKAATKGRRARSGDDGLYEKSNWNLFLERKLGVNPPLGVYEHRLADAIARHTLGYNRLTRAVGQQTLRTEADLDGRSFGRALQGLIDKGLIRCDSPGRNKRSVYTLVTLDDECAEADHPSEDARPF
jgi:hypothetical protein